MARILVTGSSDGLGLRTGQLLIEQGHEVVLHARSDERATDTRRAAPAAEAVLVGDVSTIAAMRDLAAQANASGRFGAVVHNVGLGHRTGGPVRTEDGLSQLWAVNVLAPYVLTGLLTRPDRLVYLSSGLHTGGDPGLADPQWQHRRWDAFQAYSDTKLHDTALALGVARWWPDVLANAVNPGWVATAMGGAGAPDDLDEGCRTQVRLAAGDLGRTTGGYLFHERPADAHPAASDPDLQDRLRDYCAGLSGVDLDG